METHKIDSLIKDALNDSENFYDSEAMNAKERIWNHIPTKKQVKPLYYRLLAAACILLMIGFSVVTFSNLRYKSTIKTLAESNTNLRNEILVNNQKSLTKQEAIAESFKPTPDTIYVEKKMVEYKVLATTTYVTDTVYVEQIVFVEKEPDANLLALNENVSSLDSPDKYSENCNQSEIIISNSEAVKKEKRKKFQIKLGGNRTKNRNGTLAVTTKL